MGLSMLAVFTAWARLTPLAPVLDGIISVPSECERTIDFPNIGSGVLPPELRWAPAVQVPLVYQSAPWGWNRSTRRSPGARWR